MIYVLIIAAVFFVPIAIVMGILAYKLETNGIRNRLETIIRNMEEMKRRSGQS